jgi:O-antigen/teichoic acid export membrane protein
VSRRSRDTTALAAGSAVSGVLAYVVFAVTTRGLGVERAAPVTVLWSYWALTGAAFTFPIQHWITRTAIAHGEGAVRRSLPQLSLVVLGASMVAGVVATLVRDVLFHRDDLWFPSLVCLVTVGSAVTGVARGVLTARRRMVSVGLSLVVENGIRCVVVGALFAVGSSSVEAYGLALVAGNLMVLMWPSSLVPHSTRGDQASHRRAGVLTFLAGAGAGQLVNQAILTGGPVALALVQGSQREVTTLFAALALYRAPYMLALGMVPQLLARVTRMVLDGHTAAVRRLTWLAAVATAFATTVAAAGAAALGPAVLELVFGAEVVLGAGRSALVGAGCALAVGNLVLMVVILGHDQPGRAAHAWTLAGAVAVVLLLALVMLDPLDRTACAFLGAEAVAFAALLYAAQRPVRRAGT